MGERDRAASEEDAKKGTDLVEDGPGEPVKDSSNGPGKDSSNGPVKDSSNGPVKDSSNGPVKDSSNGPVKDSSNGPGKNDASGDREELTKDNQEDDSDVGGVEDATASDGMPFGRAYGKEGGIDLSDESSDVSSKGGFDGSKSLLHRFRHENDGALMWLREMLFSVAVVLVLGLILFSVSGVWPPMVAVESGSMEPNMEVGDLVFVTEPGRFAPDAAGNDIGVVTHEAGIEAEYQTFGSYGSVVIFQPPGRTASPIIHRAMFHVEEGENWYDRADEQYHNAADCGELRHCPAPHAGFITLGDNNGAYDQANGIAAPVKADWVTGVARLRVPYLGYVRLIATGEAEFGDVLAISVETNGYLVGDQNASVGEKSQISSGTEARGVSL